jgi:hypothetical protein
MHSARLSSDDCCERLRRHHRRHTRLDCGHRACGAERPTRRHCPCSQRTREPVHDDRGGWRVRTPSPASIRRWIRTGRLQSVGVGRTIRVRVDDLVAALLPKAERQKEHARGANRELSPEDMARRDIAYWDGERQMEARPLMTADEAVRIAGPLTASELGGREGARARMRNKERELVREGKLSTAEFKKRQAHRDQLSRLDRARRVARLDGQGRQG